METRLNYAEYLMRSTSLSLSEIAAQVGYSNLNNFSQIYIKYKKITPSKFRSLLNSEDKFDIVNKGHTKN
ncbi:MAG: helix-turn-helix domain-containing protein [Oscillospiraceae bacterium]|nr:helix-turn-helix domain-containing protein [Oscillospiraceae bacterium]